MDIDATDIYKLDILAAMRALKNIWVALPADVFKHDWYPIELPYVEPTRDCVAIDHLLCADSATLNDQLQKILPAFSLVSVNALLNPAEENACIEELDDEALVVCALSESDYESKKGTIDPVVSALPSVVEKLKGSAICMRIVDSKDLPDDQLHRRLCQLQHNFRQDKARIALRTTIERFYIERRRTETGTVTHFPIFDTFLNATTRPPPHCN